MKILSLKHPGLIHICSSCGCLYQYTIYDIYENLIYCPKCKNADKSDVDKDYNGIKENEK